MREKGLPMSSKQNHSKCPLCPENGKVTILDETLCAYLVRAKDKTGSDLEGRYLIVPKQHITSVDQLPNGWMRHMSHLMKAVPELSEGADYNLSLNYGEAAGQTLRHLHWWVIIRTDDLGVGMSAMIEECTRLQHFIPA